MSLFPSILWQKVLQWTSSDPDRQSDSTLAHLDAKFQQIEQETLNNATESFSAVAPHLHPLIYPPFDTSQLSHHQHELRLRNSKHERHLSLVLDELNRKVQREYAGNFEEYVRREILGKVQGRNAQALSLDEILEDELKEMLQKSQEREEKRRKWLKYDFMEHYGAEWDARWRSKQGLIKDVEKSQIDSVLDQQSGAVGKVGSGESGLASQSLLKGQRETGSQWEGGIDDGMLLRGAPPTRRTPHSSLREDASLRYSQNTSNGTPYSNQYRLARAHLFEKKIMQIFQDPLTKQKDGRNIFEDPFGLGLEPSLEAYHPHHFVSMVREERPEVSKDGAPKDSIRPQR